MKRIDEISKNKLERYEKMAERDVFNAHDDIARANLNAKLDRLQGKPNTEELKASIVDKLKQKIAKRKEGLVQARSMIRDKKREKYDDNL